VKPPRASRTLVSSDVTAAVLECVCYLLLSGDVLRFLIVIPCYNEEANIVSTLGDLRAHVPDVPVVLVDDGSSDDTRELVKEYLSEKVRLLRHAANLGYGSAVQTGVKYAIRERYDAVVLFDADGQHSAADLRPAMAMIESGEADAVVGSRFLGSCDYPIPLPRMLGIRLFRFMLRVMSGLRITDPTSGLQVLNRRALGIIDSDNFSVEFPDADMLMTYSQASLKVVEFPAAFKPRGAGVSMHSTIKGFYYLYKVTFSMLMVASRPGREEGGAQ